MTIVCSGCDQDSFSNAVRDHLAALDLRILNVDRADAELFVAEAILVVMRHVVFDEVGCCVDLANQVSLVAADVEITMTDLRVVFFADGVVTLADVDGDMGVAVEVRDGEIDSIDRRGITSLSSAMVKSGSSIWICWQPASTSFLKL